MKHSILAILLALSSSTVFAEDTLPEAPKELVKDFTEMCLNWAKEDDTAPEELKTYVLNCVNDELTSEGYKKVTEVKI